MAIAIASTLGIHVGGRPLFDDVSFKLEAGDRMTLAGRNGAGKSTLLRILAGELSTDAGELTLRRGTRIALHDQRPPRGSATSLADYAVSGRSEMFEAEAELARVEGVMAGGDSSSETLRAYSDAQALLEAGGGYRWRDQVQAVLTGLGFDEETSQRSLSTFSGGELTRASLARALATKPDLLLLDEPTNHLDIPTLEWLEGYLVDVDAAVVLVAHDRWFLEAVGTSVLELEAGRGRYFSGPWHAWRQEQAARELALGRAIDRQQAEIARMERFVERFRAKATKARQAQSKLKQIEKIKANAAAHDPRDKRQLRFSFDPPERAGRVVVTLKDATIEVPGRTLLASANLELERGEHAVLVGPNGSGKTSLIETIAGERGLGEGTLRHGHNVQIGYLSQHAESAAGDGSVLDAVQRATGLSGQKARSLLGGFLFSGAEAEKALDDISGGEQRRLSLAILVTSGANVLILDEPTNHLDLESREALEDALLEFEGAVLLISHDRALLEAVGTRTFVCDDGELTSYPGPWADYQRDRDEAGPSNTAAKRAAKTSKKEKAKAGGPSKNAVRKVGDLEKQIERAETDLVKLEDELADPAIWASPGKAQRATARHEQAKREIAKLYESWEAAQQ